MIHFLTMALGGEGYLNFMGNEVSTLFHAFASKTAAASHREVPSDPVIIY